MTYDPAQPLLPQLRLAEQTERDELVRFKLRAAGEELEAALSRLARMPSGENLAVLVGLFASGKRCLEQAGSQGHLHSTPAPERIHQVEEPPL